ncbi:hypothetical protein D3C84_893160 [compost metagenome]
MQIFLEHEGDFAFGLGCDQTIDGDGGAVGIEHVREQMTEVRLIDAEHVHDHFAGDADLFSDDPLAVVKAWLDHCQLYLIGLLQGHVRIGVGQRRQSLAVAEGLVQLLAENVDLLLIHE